ncbi:MAG: metal ABC transporter ATP-binding protein [Terrisporobacter othiniensis]|uniref:Metal ABC transporter ATP-binding protein n=1 Tax=Terrisporobacter hibernicus TaxID=2813371 RepID=A0AAX2ZDS6_9FIRM|nr:MULTISPECIES: metal ABC transporter ATP-binding protein [Terrisporobacter]MBN9645946.1 metal ABC transporter ATP-binding protein [Terrisporobacter glycolicus]MDU4861020.1 metal ABC transporter ATP-binding protein [Terrisporobacter othiniensis]MDU6993598.1 metal ABC transporter ATP-binding protein [Terrisporobacter othiniensis]UEL47418.1 metal ABC transporter ATP-binding protein [Terrisporobacter hibernicus]SFJ14648.1 zinc transport system ATP-binding protein [Terrisporobacter glycolicus]
MKNIISIENVSFAYNKENVLQDIILSIDEGDFVGIIGCNGSGKSTLMKLLIGQLNPSKGKIKLFSEDLDKSNNLNKIGYVPQISLSSGANFPATVEEIVMANLYSKVGFMKFPKKEHKQKVKEALKIVNMQDYSKRLIGNLSGGQQQRVMIAKALVSDPKIIILDEPTTGIDAASEEQLYTLLERLNKESKITIVIVSHDFAKISKYTNKIFVVENNKVSLMSKGNEV